MMKKSAWFGFKMATRTKGAGFRLQTFLDYVLFFGVNLIFIISVMTTNPSFSFFLRVAELEDDNKMSFSNLGIVFGPTLMRPKPTGATVSLSSLVDYPHQARIVEALIVFQDHIFSPSAFRLTSSSSSGFTIQGQVRAEH